MKHIYTSIDIGTDSVKVVVCEYFKNKLNLLSAASIKTDGLKKGLIVEPNKVKASLKKAIKQVETMLNIKIKKTILTVPSYHSKCQLVKADVSILGETGVVTGHDISNVFKIAAENNIESGYTMANIIPIDFKIDDKLVKDPKGLAGGRLATRAILVSVPKKNIYSIITVLDSMHIETVDIVVNGLGDMYSFNTVDTKNDIGAIINIGSEITNVSLFNRGAILKNIIIDMGGKNIDQDIAYIYKISLEEAQKIKEKFALAHKRTANVNELYEVTNELGKKHKLNQFEVSEIVMSRLEEILNLSKKAIKSLTNKQIHYIIVTGGASNMSNFEYIVHQVLGKNASVGNIKLIGARNNKYSSAVGNIIYFIDTLKLKGANYSMISESDEEELSSPKKNILNISNESMLGKVFGYFFGE